MQVMLIHIVGVVPQLHRSPALLGHFNLDRDRIGIWRRRLAAAITNAYAGLNFVEYLSRDGDHTCPSPQRRKLSPLT